MIDDPWLDPWDPVPGKRAFIIAQGYILFRDPARKDNRGPLRIRRVPWISRRKGDDSRGTYKVEEF